MLKHCLVINNEMMLIRLEVKGDVTVHAASEQLRSILMVDMSGRTLGGLDMLETRLGK